METARIKIVILIMLFLALYSILKFIQKKELQLKYSLVWLAVDALMIIAVAFPNLLMSLAHLLGVYSVTNMLFFLGIMFVLAICFSLTVALSRASERIRQLSQEMALKEHLLKQLIEKNSKDE